jgi:cytochrome c peroxidase
MRRLGSRAAVAMVALLFGLGWAPAYAPADGGHHGNHGKKHQDPDSLPNNFPHRNEGGYGATFSTQGFVSLIGEYFQAQGTNGRSCGSCHIPEDAWAITPRAIQRLFKQTDGTDPIFNPLDANNPDTGDFATEHGRKAAYSMMLKHGLFRRGGAFRAEPREWDVVAVDDPHGFACLPTDLGCPTTGRLVHWRRAMPTINFALGSTTINWDGSNSAPSGAATVLGGLENQARRNVNGGQQGPSLDGVTLLAALPNFPAPIPPFPDPRSAFIPIIADIVNFEFSLFTAQLSVPGVGRLDAGGARGGPEKLSQMVPVPPATVVAGRFDLFDAWQHDKNPRRRQIFRGQELFNNRNGDPVTGPRCSGCHNSPNNGTNVNNTLFNIQTASVEARIPGLTVHTFQRRTAPGAPIETLQLTDAGRGNVTGLWTDLGRFKTPTIRGLAARAPYFHNGIAETLEDVVRHYEQFLGFNFTHRERDDLVAFLNAL